MNNLEDYLSPLLDRITGSVPWFFGTALVLVTVCAGLGALAGGGYGIHDGLPAAYGFVTGLFLFMGLFALAVHYSRRHSSALRETVEQALADSHEAIIRLLEHSTGRMLTEVEQFVEAVISQHPGMSADMAAELRRVVTDLRSERAEILADARKPPAAE